MAQAIASLAAGGGPARGSPMDCSQASGSVTCSTVSPAGGIGGGSGPTIPSNVTPPARFGAGLSDFVCACVNLQGVLLFGGANSTGVVFNDTWEFSPYVPSLDFPFTGWKNVTSSVGCFGSPHCPAGRHDMAFDYDSEDVYTVMFGGCGGLPAGHVQSTPGCGGAGELLGDTWIFVKNGSAPGNWTKLSPSASPSARFASAITDFDDSNGGFMLLFGGCGAACPLGDTWKFLAGVWTNITPSGGGPSSRYGAALGMAALGATLSTILPVLFGGCSNSVVGCVNGAMNDSWQFSFVALQPTWTVIHSSVACRTLLCPPARYFAAYMTTDWFPIGIALLVYGGASATGSVLGNTTDPGGSWWSIGGGSSTWVQHAYPPYNYLAAGSPPTPPAPRYDGGLVITHDGLAIFGGSSPTGSSLGDFWFGESHTAYNASLISPPTSPSARFGETMTWDPNAGYLVMYGGCGSSCGSSDTWAYTANITGLHPDPLPWNITYYTTAGRVTHQGDRGLNPPARFNASMVFFDDTQANATVDILFGGMSSTGLLGDTWKFNSSNAAWTNITASVGTAPSPRESAIMAFDPNLNSTHGGAALLFGGWTASGPSSQTWELARNPATGNFSWSLLPYSGPGARYGAAATYDTYSGNVVLFGGCGSTCPLQDTWNFTTSPTVGWAHCLTSGCSAPPGRWGATMTYDAALDSPIMFGGCGSSVCPLGDTWAFQPRPSLVGWRNETPSGSVTPRFDGAMAYDPAGGYIVLFGGVGPRGQLLGDFGSYMFKLSIALTPEWAPANTSTLLVPPRAPLGRFGASMADNPTGQYVLLFGGCEDTGLSSCGPLAAASDTWTFYNGTWHWICIGCGPSARWDSSLTYDVSDGYFLLVGGCSGKDTTCSSTTVDPDYWKYSASAGWVSLGNFSGGARGDASLTYDSGDNEAVLYGGIGCAGSVCGDSWTYSAGTWHSVTVPSQLGARFGAAITYFANPGNSYVLLFGGQSSSGTVHNDTWAFTASGGWHHILTTSAPPGRYDASMDFDSSADCAVLFGGVPSSNAPLNDTWIWCAGSPPWVQLTIYPLPPAAPPSSPAPVLEVPAIHARWSAAMVYISAAGPTGYTLLFGGATAPAVGPTGSTTGGYTPGQGDSWLFLVQPTPVTGPYWLDVSRYT